MFYSASHVLSPFPEFFSTLLPSKPEDKEILTQIFLFPSAWIKFSVIAIFPHLQCDSSKEPPNLWFTKHCTIWRRRRNKTWQHELFFCVVFILHTFTAENRYICDYKLCQIPFQKPVRSCNRAEFCKTWNGFFFWARNLIIFNKNKNKKSQEFVKIWAT